MMSHQYMYLTIITTTDEATLTLSVMGCRRTLQVMGGGYYNHGLKQIFPYRFLAVSLHISIVLYIRTSHAKGIISSFKTLDLRAFQKSSPKARKKSASKFIKEKLKKIEGPLTLEDRQTKSGAARAFNFFFKMTVKDILKKSISIDNSFLCLSCVISVRKSPWS